MIRAVVISIAVFCIMIIFRKYIVKAEEYFKINKLNILIIVLGSVIVGIIMLSPTLRAKWNIIDDHEIMHFIGKQKALNVSKLDLPLYLSDTEVGQFGKITRFRPAYCTIRIMETFIWGNSATGWWALMMLFFIITFAIVWYLVSKPIGIISGGIFSLWVFSQAYWTDIYGRLGPAEIYCAIGLALYSLGFFIAVQKVIKSSEKPPVHSWILMILGGVLAIGSKENFIIMVVPAFLLLLFLLWKKRSDWLAWFTTALIALSSLLVLVAIGIAVSHTGHDIYDTKISGGSSITVALNVLTSFKMLRYCIAVIITVVLFGVIAGKLSKESFAEYVKLTGICFGVIFLLGILVISQKVFYSGHWPNHGRYDFPGMLAMNFYVLSIAVYTLRMLKLFKVPGIVPYVFLSAISSVILIPCIKSNMPIHTSAVNAQKATRDFTLKINQTIKIAKEKPEMPILFESYTIWDCERIASLRRFMLAGNVSNKMFLKIHDQNGYYDANDSLQNDLHNRLVRVSEGGFINANDKANYTANYTQWGFDSLSNLPKQYCSIFISSSSFGSNVIGVY